MVSEMLDQGTPMAFPPRRVSLIYSILCDCMCPSALSFPSGCHKKNSVVVEKAWCVVTLPSFQAKDFSEDFVVRKTMSHTGLSHSISGVLWEAVRYCEEQRAAGVTLAWVRNLAQAPQLYETEILLWLWASPCEIGFELLVIIFLDSWDNMWCVDSVEQTFWNILWGTDIVLKHHRFCKNVVKYSL